MDTKFCLERMWNARYVFVCFDLKGVNCSAESLISAVSCPI